MAKNEKKSVEETSLALRPGVTQIQGANASDADEMFKRGFRTEVVLQLKEKGQWVEGFLEGPGAPIDLAPDPKTGEIRQLRTWRLRNANAIGILIGSSQLNARLAGVKAGTYVRVERMGQVETRGGFRVNTYVVWEMDEAAQQATFGVGAEDVAPAPQATA